MQNGHSEIADQDVCYPIPQTDAERAALRVLIEYALDGLVVGGRMRRYSVDWTDCSVFQKLKMEVRGPSGKPEWLVGDVCVRENGTATPCRFLVSMIVGHDEFLGTVDEAITWFESGGYDEADDGQNDTEMQL